MGKKLHLLQVAGSAVEGEKALHVLAHAGWKVLHEHTDRPNWSDVVSSKDPYDLVLVYRSAHLSFERAMSVVVQVGPKIPCILITPKYNHEVVQYVKAGAVDCIQLDEIGALVEAVTNLPYSFTQAHKASNPSLSERTFSEIFSSSPEPITISRLSDSVYLEANDSFFRTFGYSRDELIGKPAVSALSHIWINKADREYLVERIRRHGIVEGFEANFKTRNGEILTGLLYARSIQFKGEECILVFSCDITSRKRSEEMQKSTLHLLHICNQSRDMADLAKEVTHFFKELSGCEAVALRLKDGDDFPFYRTEGFSNKFVVSESRLCSYDKAGEPLRDSNGAPILACTCGKILRGDFDPTKPYFTKRGTFWTNSTTDLLASMSPEERPKGTRDRCIKEGYESIALVPLRTPQGTTGLLLLNDHAKDRFTQEKIEFIETLAEYVTIALEKQKSEYAQRANEERLREMLNTAEAGYFFIDSEGRYKKVNGAWLRMHGYAHETEVVGRHFTLVLPEIAVDSGREIFESLLAGIPLGPAELPRKRKDGTIGYHTLSAHPVKQGEEVVGLEGFIIDTTTLRIAKEEYQMLFEQMLDGFVLYEVLRDASGKAEDCRFLSINPAFERICVGKASDVVGHRLREVLPQADMKWIETYAEVERTGVPQSFEGFSPALNKHLELSVFKARSGQVGCVFRDISARKQLETQLLHSQKMDAVGQLAGGVAHDFNNFLAAIMMHLNLLQRTPGMSAEIVTSLRELEAEAKRASSLTRQLLMFSHRQSMQFVTTDLNELLSNLLKMLRRLIDEHIKLTFENEDGPLWIMADPGMMDQVIMNLCVNARDAMPHGGHLRLRMQALHLTHRDVPEGSGHEPGDYVCLTVSDDGAGMSAETQQHIFEPFFTTKEAGKGTGLGLATVYSIVKQHHGWIEVKSQLGRGTVFRIYLPAADAPSANDKTGGREDEVKGGGEGILVVEDDDAFRNMVVMSLRVLGYKVFHATSGKTALDVWRDHSSEIDLVFTDHVMPGGMTGLQLCHQLRTSRPSIKMLITTGYMADRIKGQSLEAEGIAFLSKPFSAETLANAVRQCIDSIPVTPA